MAENLKTTKLNDGTALSLNMSHNESYCWYDNNEAVYKNTYGALYTGHAKNNSKLCPTGWHIPTDAEWAIFTWSSGWLKETGTTHWNSPNTGATNSAGFTALPGGRRGTDGKFGGMGSSGNWWSASGWNRSIYYNSDIFTNFIEFSNAYLSVRCIKDN
jgi:uncharacterized protein (TIGR02145 family)